MRKKRNEMEPEPRGNEPPVFICQDRQCFGPMMTRVYGIENPQPEDRRELIDLRENIPFKKKIDRNDPDRY
jgi:hypothetical protein